MKYLYIIDNYFQDALYRNIINVIASGIESFIKYLKIFHQKI
jgi:hypothetical protein